ncbi:MAG: hypothetical protein JWL73_3592, partial [Actinomycetia bacterium]|nr:hypothetical protein [Actinomycetes bacterium]
SKGQQLIPIPNLVGMTGQAALAALTAAGFTGAPTVYGKPGGVVISQAPGPGSAPLPKTALFTLTLA